MMEFRRLTDDERELLAAVHAVLEIPYPASHEDRRAFELALRERVFRLLGITDDLSGSYTSYLHTLQNLAARPLAYEPAPPEVSP